MDTFKRLLSYVEIKTKITSVFPFLLTLAYLFYGGKEIDLLRSSVFFLGMLLFDLTATTINNYSDTKKNHQALQFKRTAAKAITLLLLALSIFMGLYLVYLTDIVVLLLGGLCFFFGVFYSFGPVPISHGPYGEVISGLFYGVLIPAILVYINITDELLKFSLSLTRISFEINFAASFGLALLSVVPFCLTANIMLANNISDREHDVRVGRFTLAYYLKEKSLFVFSAFYYIAYASVIVMVIFRYLSPLSLGLLLTLVPVQKNINMFYKKQVKEETFIVSIKNFLIIIIAHTLLIFISGLIYGRW